MPELLDVPYMQRALAAGLLLSVPLGLLGVWVVLRGLAFFSHAVGVATFPGVVVGLGVPALGPVGGSLLAAGAFAAGVDRLERDHRLRGGAITGIALSAFLAVGAVLLTTLVRESAPVESLLFGSLLAVSGADLVRCALVAVLGAAVTALALPRLAASTFDPEWARAAGGRPRGVETMLLATVALTVVVALPAVGSLLVSGLLVVPAATARLVCDRLGPMLAAAVGLCAAEVVTGLVLARALDVPPGAAVATLAGIVFGLVALGAGLARSARTGSAT